MRPILLQIDVEKEFASKGCQLLDKYEGNRKSMQYRCKCGEIARSSLVSFRSKDKACYKCSQSSAGRSFTYEEVKQYFSDQGYELLDTEYKRNTTLLNYRCSCGHTSKMHFGNFRSGRRCPKCKGNKQSARLRLSDEVLDNFYKTYGCLFVRSWIQDKRSRIEYICKCGSLRETYWNGFNKPPICKKCNKAKKNLIKEDNEA